MPLAPTDTERSLDPAGIGSVTGAPRCVDLHALEILHAAVKFAEGADPRTREELTLLRNRLGLILKHYGEAPAGGTIDSIADVVSYQEGIASIGFHARRLARACASELTPAAGALLEKAVDHIVAELRPLFRRAAHSLDRSLWHRRADLARNPVRTAARPVHRMARARGRRPAARRAAGATSGTDPGDSSEPPPARGLTFPASWLKPKTVYRFGMPDRELRS